MKQAEKPTTDELLTIFRAGPFAYLNGLGAVDPESWRPLSKFIASHEPPDVSDAAMRAFGVILVGLTFAFMWLLFI